MLELEVVLTYNLRRASPDKHRRVRNELRRYRLSDAVNGAALPNNMFYLKFARKDAATAIQELRDFVTSVFRRENVTGPVFICVIGSDGGWEKRYIGRT
jgi:hypothetical protein